MFYFALKYSEIRTQFYVEVLTTAQQIYVWDVGWKVCVF